MEKLANCEIIMDIELIENISGANQYFEVIFSTKDEKKYKIILDSVSDMRYSIENASIDRFCEFDKQFSEGIVHNSFYVVENSKYIEYFEYQVSGTRPIDNLKHYIILDKVDTILDILTSERLTLVEI